ncbi:DUF1045 domain-containing protein [Pseudotabrizicola sp. L79]|uniref:DUF1045 domain-containing protein n=1 Tax=Pseudotabrizicola sp. L79 TaxID=3118402 RepID=UPI002F92EB67
MQRFAVYFAPREGAFATHAAAWLGWDAALGKPVAHPKLAGLPAPLANLTATPRKYGFHATIRAPFRPVDGLTAGQIAQTIADLAHKLAPVTCAGLQIENLHGFLALTPIGREAALRDLAAQVVAGTNALRAPLTATERAKRRPDQLSPRQLALLDHWGYPGVMEEFRFHLTLTGQLAADQVAQVTQAAQVHFGPVLPRPFVVQDLCLFGEDAIGRFHLLHRYPLSG